MTKLTLFNIVELFKINYIETIYKNKGKQIPVQIGVFCVIYKLVHGVNFWTCNKIVCD